MLMKSYYKKAGTIMFYNMSVLAMSSQVTINLLRPVLRIAEGLNVNVLTIDPVGFAVRLAVNPLTVAIVPTG